MARASKASKATKKTKKAAAKKAAAKKAVPRKSKKAAAKKTKKAATGKSASARGSKKRAKKTPARKTRSAKTPSRKKTAAKKSDGASTKSTKVAAAKKAPKKTTKKTTKKATSRSKKARSPFDSRFLESMRKSLHSERDVYERQARQLRAEADSLVADLDPGDVQFDEESGEGDTIAVERNRDLALASKALEMIEEIDHALAKFDLGTYGICEVSEEPIPKERLEAIPWAREKVEYKVGGFGRR